MRLRVVRLLLASFAVGLGLSVTAMAAPLIDGVEVIAKSAILMEAESGRILFEHNAHQRTPMASTTKIVTTWLVLEHGDLDTPFVVDPKAIRTEGSSMGLKEGDAVTLRTLCYGMMLPSGNDAANAAAVRVAGSIEAFVEMMNQRVAQLGLQNTSFATPSGLDGKDHYSTAYDMAMLTREAMKNPDFEQITGTKSVKVSFGNPPYDRWLSNHNRLLRTDEGIIGGKTGYTEKSGRCLVSVARREGLTLICVTLGAADDWNIHRTLYNKGYELLEPVNLTRFYEGVKVEVAGGTTQKVALKGEGSGLLSLTVEEAAQLEVDVRVPPFVYAPVEQDELLGEVICKVGGVTVFSQSLLAAEEIPSAHPEQPPFSLWSWLSGMIQNIFRRN